MIAREAEEIRLVKERTRAAIDLAMLGEWEEAAQVNREILDLSPTNVEAMNRLGKALTELGRKEQARDVFLSALVLHPSNPIALKNVARLRAEAESEQFEASRPLFARGQGVRANGRLIAESTKSAEVALLPAGAQAPASPGAPVTLGFRGPMVVVSDEYGSCLGILPPSLSRRLSALMNGGNRYDGVVVSGGEGAVRVLLREARQHPSQRGKASFPPAPPPPDSSSPLDDEGIEDAPARESAGAPLALLDDEPELAAASASIGIMDDGVMPELPEEVFA